MADNTKSILDLEVENRTLRHQALNNTYMLINRLLEHGDSKDHTLTEETAQFILTLEQIAEMLEYRIVQDRT
jgi:hypothetical protein